MRDGLLIYPSYQGTFNIGDYIQSLAARQYLSEPLIYVNRENLDEYKGEPIKLIMNGWFLHEPIHWPPSRNIEPLFVAFHLNSESYHILEKSENIDYFKKYEPIGCRDHHTKEILETLGIKAYFTGCLTLTLGKTNYSNEKSGEIIFVDPYFEVKRDVFSIIHYSIYTLVHLKMLLSLKRKMFPKDGSISILKSACFYMQYRKLFNKSTIINARYIGQGVRDSDFGSEDEKFNYAQQLITIYAKAKFVITSRIHCALPCLGLETSVVYIDNENQSTTSYCRLKGLRELFNTIFYSHGTFRSSDVDIKNLNFDTIKNKRDFVELKENLISNCQGFLISNE